MRITELKENRAVRRLFVVLCLLVMSYVLITYNSIYRDGQRATDSGVFATVAMQMQAGMMPYRDTFDHKGPLLYIYNFIGNSISLEWGILIVEFVSAFATLLAFYKIARRYCGILFSLATAMGSIIPVIAYFSDGNFTEEYAVSFIAWGLWVFIEYFQFGRVSKRRLALCGFCFGAVCLLRANMTAVWAVFCIAVLVKCIKEKKFADLWHFLLYFMAGFALIVLPIVLWLAFNGAFKDFVADYLLFNGRYITVSERASLVKKCRTFLYFATDKYAVISAVIIAFLYLAEKETFSAIYLIYTIATLLSICLSGMRFDHYGMILSPVLSYPLSRLLSRLAHRLQSTARRINKETVGFALILVIAFCPWRRPIYTALGYVHHFIHGIPRNDNSEYNIVARYVTSNTDKDDRITVFGNCDYIYVLSKRLPASKYSYQFPIGQVYPAIMDEFYGELDKFVPKLFVVNKQRISADRIGKKQYAITQQRLIGFLSRHGYHKVDAGVENFDIYSLAADTSHD